MEGVNGRIAVEDCMPQLVRNDDPLNAVGQITVDYNQFAPRRNQEKALAGTGLLPIGRSITWISKYSQISYGSSV